MSFYFFMENNDLHNFVLSRSNRSKMLLSAKMFNNNLFLQNTVKNLVVLLFNIDRFKGNRDY